MVSSPASFLLGLVQFVVSIWTSFQPIVDLFLFFQCALLYWNVARLVKHKLPPLPFMHHLLVIMIIFAMDRIENKGAAIFGRDYYKPISTLAWFVLLNVAPLRRYADWVHLDAASMLQELRRPR